MILLLKSGDQTIVAQAWVAEAQPGERVLIRLPHGTVGLEMVMEEFVSSVWGVSIHLIDLRDRCEDPTATLLRFHKK